MLHIAMDKLRGLTPDHMLMGALLVACVSPWAWMATL